MTVGFSDFVSIDDLRSVRPLTINRCSTVYGLMALIERLALLNRFW